MDGMLFTHRYDFINSQHFLRGNMWQAPLLYLTPHKHKQPANILQR